MMNLEFKNKNKVFINPPIQVIYEEILKKREGVIGKSGAMMIDTGEFTGRSPNDKYFVEESFSKDNLWWGPVNKKINTKLVIETFRIFILEVC